MKHSRLGELEEKQMCKSNKFGANIAAIQAACSESGGMSDSIQAIVATLTPEQQERAKILWEELVDLNVKEGLRNRLMGLGHMGALNDPIWKYIYKLRSGAAKKVRDRGGWLIKCLINDKLTNYKQEKL